jgi:hypothetical protein
MTLKLDVPDDRLGIFQRMKRQLPLEVREDEQVLRRMLAYLKLGGERLVRQYVATLKADFPEDTVLFKRRGMDENLDDGANDGESEEGEETGVALGEDEDGVDAED